VTVDQLKPIVAEQAATVFERQLTAL
jgi:hypothetical protein